MRSAITNYVSISDNDPVVIFKNRIKSFVEALLEPSAMFDGNETAARLSWEVSPKFSEVGKLFVSLYMSSTSSKLNL